MTDMAIVVMVLTGRHREVLTRTLLDKLSEESAGHLLAELIGFVSLGGRLV